METIELSRSLEDYLAAIRGLALAQRNVRVKDIAAIRNVKPGSVSPALARLANLGLIEYERRESIRLTTKGSELARQLMHRRQLLTEFFENILKIPPRQAREQACAMEHCLTEQATARLEGLIAHIQHGRGADIFVSHSIVSPEITIAEMLPGQRAVVRHIRARGELNHQLIDMGLLPDAGIQLISGTLEAASSFVVALQGYEVTLTTEQANAVLVSL